MVTGKEMLESHSAPFDLGIALHGCGTATDAVLDAWLNRLTPSSPACFVESGMNLSPSLTNGAVGFQRFFAYSSNY